MTRPRLSVIIASYNALDTIGACLESLESQLEPSGDEVILVDSSQDGTADFVRSRFAWVHVRSFVERKFCGEARNFGIRQSRGEIIAFIDADCVASRDWAQKILSAHRRPEPAIGGAVANGNPHSYTGWAAYFTEFSQWMPGSAPGRLPDIAGANMSYKREIFRELGPLIEGTYCSDTEFHWRLLESGHSLHFDPSILVFHHNIERLGRLLTHEFLHGRSFAAVRSHFRRFSPSRRIAYSLLAPAIWLKLLFERIGQNLTNRIYLRHFLQSLPLILLSLGSWCLGEAAGYLDSR